MRRALELAKKGQGKVSPNPMVGAVLVKNGKIIAEGYHEYFGGPHAEVNALKKMTKSQIRGSILYVTLEPCCFFGKTPPCTNFLLSKGVKNIVVAMRDPNPLVAGKGILELKKAGVDVRVGVLEEEAKSLNRVFIKNKTNELPFVSIKLGLTLDGKIAVVKGKSGYITNEESRSEVHRIRANVDAILTTSETVLKDNPHLGVRMVKGRDPLRIIIDSKLRTDPKASVYRDNNVIVATTLKSSSGKRKIFEGMKIKLLVYNKPLVPLETLMKDLYQLGICHIMVEAGSKLVTSLISKKLADEIIFFIAPKILGKGIPWIRDLGIKKIENAYKLKGVEVQSFDEDIMIRGTVVY